MGGVPGNPGGGGLGSPGFIMGGETRPLIFWGPTKPDPLLCPSLCKKPCMMMSTNVKSLRCALSQGSPPGKLRPTGLWERLVGLVPLLTCISEEAEDKDDNLYSNIDPALGGSGGWRQGTGNRPVRPVGILNIPPGSHTTQPCQQGTVTTIVTVCWPCVGTGSAAANRQTNPPAFGGFP